MVYVGEKIAVNASFRNGAVIPSYFIWNEKIFKIERVFLNYSKKLGEANVRFFSVGVLGRTSCYELSFNPNLLIWRLEAIGND